MSILITKTSRTFPVDVGTARLYFEWMIRSNTGGYPPCFIDDEGDTIIPVDSGYSIEMPIKKAYLMSDWKTGREEHQIKELTDLLIDNATNVILLDNTTLEILTVTRWVRVKSGSIYKLAVSLPEAISREAPTFFRAKSPSDV